MKGVAAILGLILVAQVHAQQKRPWSVDRICGRVEYVKRIPEKKHTKQLFGKEEESQGHSARIL